MQRRQAIASEFQAPAPDEPIRIDVVRDAGAVVATRELFQEYAASLDHRFCFDQFREEVERLPAPYVPPDGALFLARQGSHVIGCVGIKTIEPGILELKRLYVRPGFRQRGTGRQLVTEALGFARNQHARRVQLDTLPAMVAARALYLSVGFREACGPSRTSDAPIDLALELEYPAA